MSSHVMPTYARLPVAFVRGEGAWLWDEAGKKYLDALAGIAVSGLGHGHPRLVRAIADQAAKVIHTSNLYEIPAQDQLADRICALAGMDEVFFCNSGSEANETAIKLARLYGHQNGVQSAGDHRHGARLARPHARDAVGDRQPQGAGRLRAARPRVHPRAVQRRARRPPRGGREPEYRRRAGGGAAGRRRHLRRRSRLRALPPPHLRRAELAADDRRGAERARPHRQVVRLPARRHRPRRHHAREGHRVGRAARRLRRRPPRRRRLQAGHARLDVRRRPARLRGGARHLRRDRGRRAPRPRDARRRGDPRGLPRRARRRATAWSTSAAWD